MVVRARMVAANALEFGLLGAGEGPLALCLHGFPDSAHTWRHLLPALVADVVALHQAQQPTLYLHGSVDGCIGAWASG